MRKSHGLRLVGFFVPILFALGALTGGALAGGALAGGAAAQPRLPCEGAALPAPAGPGELPAFEVWQKTWQPPACSPWRARPFSLLVALSGRFSEDVSRTDLLRRLGAFSEMESLLYWSHTRQRWRPLFAESFALEGASKDQRRTDFAPDELVQGRDVFCWQKPNSRLGGFVLRMRIERRSDSEILVSQVNLTAPEVLGFPVMGKGEVETLLYLLRDGAGPWRYYHLTRAGDGSREFDEGERASYLNRAQAYIRFLAGRGAEKGTALAP